MYGVFNEPAAFDPGVPPCPAITSTASVLPVPTKKLPAAYKKLAAAPARSGFEHGVVIRRDRGRRLTPGFGLLFTKLTKAKKERPSSSWIMYKVPPTATA